jgi:hypothetical protein
MAEVDKKIETVEETSQEEGVSVEIENKDMPETVEEAVSLEESFYSNIADDLDERVLQKMSKILMDDYKRDRVSRKDWEDSVSKGLDLLGFKYTQLTKPFRGSASVTHPLLAEAATQFQAQAYKELLPADGPVRTKVLGVETDATTNQASRVQDFMNYMLMEEMEEYTPEMDQLLFDLPLKGSAFKKVYYDEVMKRAVSKFVPAEDLIVPYYATDLMDCERITHVVKMNENDILKQQKAGFYRDIELKPVQNKISDLEKKYQELEGITPSGDKVYSFNILEMHVDLNLDDFIYDEPSKEVKIPYIVTIDEGSGEVLSIYRNYDMADETKKRKEYFVHFKFLPGLGFYGFGLIHMIGGLTRTATQALRQLLDAGTLSNLPAGFKSRGIRIRDDDQPFQPGEFRDVDAPGGNIKDQFQILPFKEPSGTLYQLLGFVVQSGQRFASITNMDVGNDAQNRAVGTTIALLERGSRVMSAVHKRCYYAMRREFKLLSKIFSVYLPPVYPYAVYGADRAIKVQDFDDRVDVIPVADPNVFSMSQRVTLANENLKIAMSNPQLHNIREAYRRVYEALGTKDIDQLLRPDEQPVPKDPAIENLEAMQMKIPTAFPQQDHDAHIAAHRAFMATRMVQINPMVYALLQGHISQHVSLKAQGEVGAMIQADPMMQQQMQNDPQGTQIQIEGMIARRIAEITTQLAQSEKGATDPLVALKQRELDLKAMEMQAKNQKDMMNMELKELEVEEKLDIDKMKLENQEDQSAERIRVAREKLKQQREIANARLRRDNAKKK